jgi:rRNA-processing protein FCF1
MKGWVQVAVSGGATTAYSCIISGMELSTAPTTRLRSECATVDDAMQRLAAGDRVVVAGSDMAALQDRLRRAGVMV